MADTTPETHDTLACAVHIVAAYTSKNAISASDIPTLLKNIHSTLTSLSSGQTPTAEAMKPAVPVKKSVTPDYIVSGRREAPQDAEALSSLALQANARRISNQVESPARLSDGRTQLRRTPLAIREEDRSRAHKEECHTGTKKADVGTHQGSCESPNAACQGKCCIIEYRSPKILLNALAICKPCEI